MMSWYLIQRANLKEMPFKNFCHKVSMWWRTSIIRQNLEWCSSVLYFQSEFQNYFPLRKKKMMLRLKLNCHKIWIQARSTILIQQYNLIKTRKLVHIWIRFFSPRLQSLSEENQVSILHRACMLGLRSRRLKIISPIHNSLWLSLNIKTIAPIRLILKYLLLQTIFSTMWAWTVSSS